MSLQNILDIIQSILIFLVAFNIYLLNKKEKQINWRNNLQRHVEFERCMKLLKANNGKGAMTPAMWLLYEEAYYSGRHTFLTQWKSYLKRLDGEANDN